jgi:AcrR family transcriptional regulator
MKSERAYTMSNRADAVASTKERIATAALELLMERRYDDVTLADIASAAGVSHQTVLNHFESKEGVAFAAAELVVESTDSARSGAEVGDTVGAVHLLVADYERMGDANVRWAMDVERLGSLAPFIDAARRSHRAWLENVFAPDMPAAGKERRRLLNALHAATDVYTWKLLRRDLGVTRPETERTMVRLVNGALGRTGAT